MNIRQMEKILLESGFELKRRNKHPIYSDGMSTITLPSSSGQLDHRLERYISLQIKKAVLKRKGDPAHENIKIYAPRPAEPFHRIPKIELKPKEEVVKPQQLEILKSQIKRQRWEAVERGKILNRILELYKAGYTKNVQITAKLIQEGHRGPKGRPYVNNDTNSLITSLRASGQWPDAIPLVPQAPTPTLTPVSAETIRHIALEILTNPSYSDSKKVRLVLAHLED